MRVRAHRVIAHLRQQWMGALALFLVLTGGVAYAAGSVFSADIVDGEVKAVDIGTSAVRSTDIGNNQVNSADVRDDTSSNGGLGAVDLAVSSVGSSEVEAESLTGDDIGNDQVQSVDVRDDFLADGGLRTEDIAQDTLVSQDIAQDTLTGPDVSDNSLTGADVDESTLGFPGAIKTFAGAVSPGSNPPVGPDYEFRGPTVSVTTTAAQPRITGAASAPLAIGGGSPGLEGAYIGLCWDSTPGAGDPPANFYALSGDDMFTGVDGILRMQSANASIALNPGTYQVGFCVKKPAGDVVTGGNVNGWVMQSG